MEVATKCIYFPNLKVDYFLKIENNDDAVSVSNIQILLNTIDNVYRIQCRYKSNKIKTI
jgi:hypothetical protein